MLYAISIISLLIVLTNTFLAPIMAATTVYKLTRLENTPPRTGMATYLITIVIACPTLCLFIFVFHGKP